MSTALSTTFLMDMFVYPDWDTFLFFFFFFFLSNLLLNCLMHRIQTLNEYMDQRWSWGLKARGLGQSQGHKKIRGQGQGQRFQEQTLLRPRTGTLEAKAKDTGTRVFSKKRSSNKFLGDFKTKNFFKKFFQAICKRDKQKRCLQIFRKISSVFQQNFGSSKTSAVLEPRTEQFLRFWGQG